jgi:hypothetical protein
MKKEFVSIVAGSVLTAFPINKFKAYRKKPVVIKALKIKEPFSVKTLEGVMHGKSGDYLVIGIAGEKYPVDAEIFKKTYEEA